MSFLKFIMSKIFLKNMLIAAGIVIILVILTMWFLKIYTDHGKAKPMPDFRGLQEQEVQELVKEFNLRYRIIDSVYINDVLPGCVVEQSPKPGFSVKDNRTALLTINAHSPEMVVIPELRDISFRQALVYIENSGFEIGEISYQPSEFDDLVLEALIDSVEVLSGDKFPRGSTINLVVGKQSGFEQTGIPRVLGLYLNDARNRIASSMLNTGVIIYDQGIINKEDSLNARVWRQRPDPDELQMADPGTSVDLWVTVDPLKIDFSIQ